MALIVDLSKLKVLWAYVSSRNVSLYHITEDCMSILKT